MSGITVLSPVAVNRVEAQAIAPRIATLDNARLGLLSNNKPNSALLLEQIAHLLGERHGLAELRPKAKPNPAVGADGLAAYASEVNAVLTALGD